jgi:hypothetical protein
MKRRDIVVAAALALSVPVGAQEAAFTAEQRAEGEAKIRIAAQHLATSVRDPSSTSFRNVFIQKRVTDKGEPLTLCGEVNGKNGYGGFTGFQPFILIGDKVSVGKVFSMDVAFLCKNRNPIIDTRDYAPEMKAAYDAALGS